jgi:patatin-like phospholipase/acyl hydrolase
LLTVNSGGVRGIVELRVLEALEKELHVPLQKFFDLVVGTR